MENELKRLRILQISPYGPPKTGGSESFCFNLSRQLHKRGYDVTIFASRLPRSGLKVDYSEGFPVKRFFCISYVWQVDPAFLIIPDILRVIKNFDLVHVHSYIYFSANQLAFCRLLKKFPLLLHLHGGLGDLGPELVGMFRFVAKRFYDKTLGKFTIQLADKIISVSSTDTKFVIKNLKINPNKITTIPNAIDTSKFSMTEQHNPRIATYIGRLVSWKGCPQMPTIFNKLIKNGIHVRVVGDGPYLNFLKKNCDKSVEFTGNIPHEDIPTILKETSIFLLPSFLEGLPTVCLEAMASGIPSVAYDVGGVKEIVKDYETGFVVEKGNITSFIQRTMELCSNTTLYTKMSNLCYERARKLYDWNVVTGKIEEEYRSMLNEN